jgi:hypothetical protein
MLGGGWTSRLRRECGNKPVGRGRRLGKLWYVDAAAASAINNLSGVTITNPTITGLSAAEIPNLSGSYLSLGGGNFTPGSIWFSAAFSTGVIAINATSTNLFATLGNFTEPNTLASIAS